MAEAVLVTGGAGYIGAQMVAQLGTAGFYPVVVDNLSGGAPNALLAGELVEVDIADERRIRAVLRHHGIACVFHFAAFVRVDESVSDPAKYYANNLGGTMALLRACAAEGVQEFIFSSTAAIFGTPHVVPIAEDHPKAPLNPYGHSKWLVEQVLPECERAYGMRAGCLRYFNAAGADSQSRIGPRHRPRTHLISRALAVALGEAPHLTVFGQDYDTQDGTCLRDYIHVEDLCAAHLKLLDYLRQGGQERAFNLGNGKGYSVLEVVEAARRVTGHPIPVIMGERREGDASIMVAESAKAIELLGWKPAHASLEKIIRDAWAWEQKLLTGQ